MAILHSAIIIDPQDSNGYVVAMCASDTEEGAKDALRELAKEGIAFNTYDEGRGDIDLDRLETIFAGDDEFFNYESTQFEV